MLGLLDGATQLKGRNGGTRPGATVARMLVAPSHPTERSFLGELELLMR
jgi:hypothetical protein